jgi:tetratricopeptide (TPR) repeat protein
LAELRGRLEEASTRYLEATRLFEDAGQNRTASRVQARLAGAEYYRGHVEQATERMQRAYAGLAGDEPDPDLAVVAAQLGRLLVLSGRYAEGVPLLEQALELAEHLELPEIYSQALSSKAIFLTWSDRLDEAGLLLRRALEVSLEHSLTAAAQRAYNNLAVVLDSQDRYAEQATLCEQALELARRAGDRVSELAMLTGALNTLITVGRWDDALTWAGEARSAEELGERESTAASLLTLVSLHVPRGELDEARLLLESAVWVGTSEDWQGRAEYLVDHAKLLRAEDQPTEALAAAEQVLAMLAQRGLGLTYTFAKNALVQGVEAALDLGNTSRADELLGMARAARPGQVTPWLRAQVARLSARTRALGGQHDQVEQRFEAAEAGFRDVGTPFDLAVALTEHAEWLMARGRQDKAEPLRANAREIFQRLRARPWLERLGPTVSAQSVSA